MSVLLETTLGDMVVDLFTKERPRSCMNFLKLCKLKYYNFCIFHSIEENYVAQTGDPSGTGRGGQSVFSFLYGEQARFFEMETVPKLRHGKRGTVSMVNNGESMHGSQFFITLAEDLDYLDGDHTVFGQVAEGFETLDLLNEVICDESKKPYRDVRISHTIILDDPFEDPQGLDIPNRSPSPSLELLKSERLGIDEELDEFAGKDEEKVKEEISVKEAKARAHVLEMIGDLHHADERPPDNVLFVCKLNPSTTAEDLEIIFSRFGSIKCCEVIKDKKTGNSLQYAFIEFEKPEYCENAYFKMDNVLIDDRRIHVDFSQSVSKNYTWVPQSRVEEKQERKAASGSNNRKKESNRSPPRRHSPSRYDSHSRKRKHGRNRRSRSPRRRHHY